MKNAIYNIVNHNLDEEMFTSGMRGMVLQIAPQSFFGSLVAILAPHLGQTINEVTFTWHILGRLK